MADRHTPFQDGPLSMEHFPSGTLIRPRRTCARDEPGRTPPQHPRFRPLVAGPALEEEPGAARGLHLHRLHPGHRDLLHRGREARGPGGLRGRARGGGPAARWPGGTTSSRQAYMERLEPDHRRARRQGPPVGLLLRAVDRGQLHPRRLRRARRPARARSRSAAGSPGRCTPGKGDLLPLKGARRGLRELRGGAGVPVRFGARLGRPDRDAPGGPARPLRDARGDLHRPHAQGAQPEGSGGRGRQDPPPAARHAADPARRDPADLRRALRLARRAAARDLRRRGDWPSSSSPGTRPRASASRSGARWAC